MIDLINPVDFTPLNIWDYFCDDTNSNDADFIFNYSRKLRLEFILWEACCAQIL